MLRSAPSLLSTVKNRTPSRASPAPRLRLSMTRSRGELGPELSPKQARRARSRPKNCYETQWSSPAGRARWGEVRVPLYLGPRAAMDGHGNGGQFRDEFDRDDAAHRENKVPVGSCCYMSNATQLFCAPSSTSLPCLCSPLHPRASGRTSPPGPSSYAKANSRALSLSLSLAPPRPVSGLGPAASAASTRRLA